MKAHAYHGLGPAEIARIVKKSDGAAPSEQGIADVLQRLADEPAWRGERKAGSGRPRSTPGSLDKAIAKEVFRRRGSTFMALRRGRTPCAGACAIASCSDRMADPYGQAPVDRSRIS